MAYSLLFYNRDTVCLMLHCLKVNIWFLNFILSARVSVAANFQIFVGFIELDAGVMVGLTIFFEFVGGQIRLQVRLQNIWLFLHPVFRSILFDLVRLKGLEVGLNIELRRFFYYIFIEHLFPFDEGIDPAQVIIGILVGLGQTKIGEQIESMALERVLFGGFAAQHSQSLVGLDGGAR